MKIASLSWFLCWVVGHCSVFAADSLVLDFESPATGIQTPGVSFQGIQVIQGQVSSSTGRTFSTSTNGSLAAVTSGARINFRIPVVKVSASVCETYVHVPLNKMSKYETAYLTAYGADGQMIGKTTTPLIYAVGEPEMLDNFNPSVISFASSVPIAEITIDTEDPFDPSFDSFFIDDLTLTVREQQPLAQPLLSIKRSNPPGRVLIVPSIPSAQLEQSPQLPAATWQAVVPTTGQLLVYATNSAMFFRAVR
jgi:hypothetical protein